MSFSCRLERIWTGFTLESLYKNNMANFLGYNIDIQVQDADFDIFPTEVVIELEDNIHSFYNTARLGVNDPTGILREYGLFTRGAPVSIAISREDIEQNDFNSYVVQQVKLEDIATPGIISGDLHVSLIHSFRAQQQIASAAFEGELSAFVEQLIAEADFRETSIESTAFQRIWYRPLWTPEHTIRKLLPEAFSLDASLTSFFAFVDSANVFHFESFETLWGTTETMELVYQPETPETTSSKTISEIYPVEPNFGNLQEGILFRSFSFAKEGTAVEEEDFALADSGSAAGSSPFVSTTSDPTLYDFEWTKDAEEKRKARAAQALLPALFAERYIVRLPLNAQLTSGKTITLSTLHLSENGREFSPVTSGKFLVESSKHRWNGPEKTGETTLLLTRPRVSYPSNYLVGEKVYNGE